jgi:hypothetical protein
MKRMAMVLFLLLDASLPRSGLNGKGTPSPHALRFGKVAPSSAAALV